MSAVNLLSAGAKLDGGTSTPLDVSAFTTLKLTATLLANPGGTAGPAWLQLWIETAQSAVGPWTQLYYARFYQNFVQGQNPEAWPQNNSQRILVSGVDQLIRVRWLGAAGNVSNNKPTDATAKFDLSVSGEGI